MRPFLLSLDSTPFTADGWRPLRLRQLIAVVVSLGFIAAARAQQMSLPATLVEGSGTHTNAGRIFFPTNVASDTVFSLQSSDAASLTTPPTVTIPAGTSNALF